jgi:DNA-binding CsgD family transcriptional regulator
VPWTDPEERRLRAGKKEDKPELWIAKRLKRTESGVSQHWRKMCREDGIKGKG